MMSSVETVSVKIFENPEAFNRRTLTLEKARTLFETGDDDV